jgi:PKD repeat protein
MFYNNGPDQIPGLIVMSLSDPNGEIDHTYNLVVALFNANDEAQTFTETTFIGSALTLHPVQVNSYDPVVRTASFDAGTGAFSVPARTTAVFVQYAAPVAAFSANLTSGVAPLQVTFTNESLGNYTSSVWDMGDGFTSTLSSPTHIYQSAGVYTVTLTVSGLGGSDDEVKANYITVQERWYHGFLILIYKND